MYISIDCDKMQFLHKHVDYKVVCNLAWIEAPGKHVDIMPLDSVIKVRHYTPTEMQCLYRSTTGDDHSKHHGDALCAVLQELADRLPISDVVPLEAEMQAGKLNGAHEAHRYVKGSFDPCKPADLFAPAALRATISEDEAANAARKRPAPAPHSVSTSSAAPVAGATPRAVRAAVPAQRTGKTRETIWKVADEMWEADGRPKDKAAVLHLRKKIMDKLEREHDVKRTSSSNELGNWAKARI